MNAELLNKDKLIDVSKQNIYLRIWDLSKIYNIAFKLDRTYAYSKSKDYFGKGSSELYNVENLFQNNCDGNH